MNGLSPRTWELVQKLFPHDAEAAATVLIGQCGRNLPFFEDKDEYELERLRFAALKISQGSLERLQEAVDEAKLDWRDELMWAGFADSVEAHRLWADAVLGVTR